MILSDKYPRKTEYSSDFTLIDLHTKDIRKAIDGCRSRGSDAFLSVSLSRCVFPEYLDGRYDDISHEDEIQTDKNGNPILYGPNIPYITPTVSYVQFLFRKIETLLSKVDAVVITEPYFSSDAGYGSAFKKEWELYYKTPWSAPEESVDKIYKTEKLKRDIICRAIHIITTLIKTHPGLAKRRTPLPVYLETGALISDYRASLVAPAAVAATTPFIDGFIIDPAMGLSRKKVITDGIKRHRNFETALLEYGYAGELTSDTDKTICLPHIKKQESLPLLNSESDEDFKLDLVAALMAPKIDRHSLIIPQNGSGFKISEEDGKRDSVYAVCGEALGRVKKGACKWIGSDDNAIGVIVGDSCLFRRRFPKNSSYATSFGEDIEYASAFYGLAMPFIDLGINVRPLPAENICRTYDYLNDYNVLVMSYDYFKPENHELHYALNAWIRSGGVLVYVGDESDPFNEVTEWWNKGKSRHPSPLNHLLETVGINKNRSRGPARRKNPSADYIVQRPVTEFLYDVGEGIFAYIPANPIHMAKEPDYRELLTKTLLTAAEKQGIFFTQKDYFSVIRDGYRAIRVSDEGKPLKVKGTLVDLFTPDLKVYTEKKLMPGECGFFYDVEEKKDDDLAIIAIGAAVKDLELHQRGISFTAYARNSTACPCRLFFPHSCEVKINGEPVKTLRDATKKTVFFTFEGAASGVEITAVRIK